MTVSAPPVAIIGGTGLNQLVAEAGEQVAVPTPYGALSSAVTIAALGDTEVAFLARHGQPHKLPPHRINYRANIWALQQLGVRHIFAVNAVGAIQRDLATGALMVPDQLIDYTYGREHTFADGSADAVLQHCDFTEPFDRRLREHLVTAAGRVDDVAVIDGGVYGVTQGPRLETAAEINRMAADGCDIVGMTAMPEAALARELGLAYASICVVANPAAGRAAQTITMEAITEVLEASMARVRRLLSVAVGLC